MTQSFQQTLRHDDYVIMSDPCANLTWIEAFLTTTDHLDLYTHRFSLIFKNLFIYLKHELQVVPHFGKVCHTCFVRGGNPNKLKKKKE